MNFIISIISLYIVSIVLYTIEIKGLKKKQLIKELASILGSCFLFYYYAEKFLLSVKSESISQYIYIYIGCIVLFTIINYIIFRRK